MRMLLLMMRARLFVMTIIGLIAGKPINVFVSTAQKQTLQVSELHDS